MTPEANNNPDHLNYKTETIINLKALSFDFCQDTFIRDFYEEKINELNDQDKWLEKNEKELVQSHDKIAQAVEDGLIADEQFETIRQFQIDKTKEKPEKVLALKSELEDHVDEIKNEVAKRLGKFLPDWTAGQAKIIFTINEKSNFSIDNDIITVDLDRLTAEPDPIETVTEGITHEVFHFWMAEGSDWSDSRQDEFSDQALKERIIFKTIDEGLAVLISGQSLEDHHTKHGESFTAYTNESFTSFNRFISENDRAALNNIKNSEFRDMGHFYVVGNEIAKAVLQHDGMEKFRILIADAKRNPVVFLERYKEISREDVALLKINL